MSNLSGDDLPFKAKVVGLILAKDAEKALELLSQHHGVVKPHLKVGMPKRYSRKAACYVAEKRTIHVWSREVLYSPQVILHEFYHHLRYSLDGQRGVEKYAERFAESYFQAYKMIVAEQLSVKNENGWPIGRSTTQSRNK